MGNNRAAAARVAAQAQGRQAPHRQPGGAHRHPVRAQEQHPLGDAPSGDGTRLRHDLLAAPQGVTRSGRVGASPRGIARPPRPSQRDRLREGILGLGERTRPRGPKNRFEFFE